MLAEPNIFSNATVSLVPLVRVWLLLVTLEVLVSGLLARSDPGGGVGELATADEFIIKQASSTSIMSVASEKTA